MHLVNGDRLATLVALRSAGEPVGIGERQVVGAGDHRGGGGAKFGREAERVGLQR